MFTDGQQLSLNKLFVFFTLFIIKIMKTTSNYKDMALESLKGK